MLENKKYVEITSNGQKIKINRSGIIGHGNPIDSGEPPVITKLDELRRFINSNFIICDGVNRKIPSNFLRHTYRHATGNDIRRGEFIYAMHLEGYDIYPVKEGSIFCYFNYDEAKFWLQFENHYPKIAGQYRSSFGRDYNLVTPNYL